MAQFFNQTRLPRYLQTEQARVEEIAKGYGLDFFPTIFEMLPYDRINEMAAYGGFPTRYPHWRYGMEYEQLSRSNEYGLSKIYELVINNNPSIAYLLEGNSLTDQKMVMCHVYGHVDFFKNNFTFRSTDLDATGPVVAPLDVGQSYDPDRKWIDKMANHGSVVRRIIDRQGIDRVEEFIDYCLSLENLIDPWSAFVVRSKKADAELEDGPGDVEVPKLKAKEYMDSFINPEDYIEEQREKLKAKRDEEKGKFPAERVQDVLLFLLENAPLERWERSVLSIIRQEAYYFVPQIQTKIMNEGWASYWHSKMMTEQVCGPDEILDYADNNAAVMATSPGNLNPYKLGVELYRSVEERWNKGQFGREWETVQSLDEKANWNQRLDLGRKKIFEVRALYNDVTFIDEFLTPEFAMQHKLFTFEWSGRHDQYEIATREFRQVKDKLLFQLTNRGNPYIYVDNANHDNRGELLLVHDHQGADLRPDYAQQAMKALYRIWKRPIVLRSETEGKPVHHRFDGEDYSLVQSEA